MTPTRSLLLLGALLLPAVGARAQEPAPAASDLRERRHALINLIAEYQDFEDYKPSRSEAEMASRFDRKAPRVRDVEKEVEKSLAKMKGFLPRFEAIDTTGFPEHEVLNQALMVRSLRDGIESTRFPFWRMPVNQFTGLHLYALESAPLPDYATLRDCEGLLAWYRLIPAMFEQTMSQMRRGMAEGLMPPRYLLEKVAEQAETIARMSPEASPFAKMLDEVSRADVPEAKKRKLRADLLKAIRKDILPAYARFAKFVREEYAPRGRTEPGYWSLPNGEAWYAFLVRQSTTTDLAPEEIHQIGLREVARIEAEMTAIAVRLGYADLRSLNAAIAGDPRFLASTPEQLVGLYKGYIDAMQAKLPELFGRLPDTKLKVREMGAYRDKELSRAAYHPWSREVVVKTREPRETLFVESTAYHEGVPGHHLQFVIAASIPTMVPFRSNLSYAAFIEGWAHYAEKLGKDVGLYQDPYSEYGRLQDEMLRAVRLVVDTGLHAKRWSRDEAIQFFRRYSAMDESEVQVEVDRYIVMPAQALGYKIGEMKILELRERARKELGERFDLRKFHDQVLGAGVLPLDLLEWRIEKWIAAEKKG
jgi:uncharacterized protein (DUF885 family)